MTLALAAGPISAEEIGPEAFDALPSSDVVILGEIHDNAAHHANQARAVAAIRPAALVFEMLTPERAARLPSDRTDAAVVGAALGWAQAGWPDFAMYHPIFTAAPDARVYGGDVAPDALRTALERDAATAFGPDAARFGLTTPLTAEDRALREEEQAVSHCYALPRDMLPGMVEAQRLRDAGLARAVTAAMEETGGPVVLITGSGHARTDRGVPAVLSVAAPALRVVSVGQLEQDPGTDAPFDLWIVTEAAGDTGDPCAAFDQPKT